MTQQFYIGIVESRADPLMLGRLQVRVFGVHTEVLTDVPTSALPWAIPLMPASSASLSGIGQAVSGYIEGTMVFVFFQDGESKQQPIILGSAHGIPMGKSPFTTGVTYDDSNLGTKKSTNSTQTPVTSTSGTPVTDSSGSPVVTETPPELDLSRMISTYGSNVTLVYQALLDYGIRDNNGIVAILSNVGKESRFIPVVEGMKYSSIARLKAIFPSKFPSLPKPEDEVEKYTKYVNNEELLANLVYANSDGNGNVNSGDGYKYRGRGFIQLTKKNNYTKIGKEIGVDLVSNPDALLTPSVSAKSVAQYFISRFGGPGKLIFPTLTEALQTVTKKVNPGGFANDYPKVVQISKLCTITESPETVADKAAEAEITSPLEPTNDIDSTATQEQINTGSTSNTIQPSMLGFKDPAGKYPLSSYLKEPDVNRLARSSIVQTIVQKKKKIKRSSIRSIGSTFSEPSPPFNGKYPYNHLYSSEGGHLSEFDDTPGSERIHTYHKSGTYTEIDNYGNEVNKIVGDKFSITERNGYIYIDGTARITVGADVKLVVGGNLDIEVDGNLNYDVGGNVTYKVGGSFLLGAGSVASIQTGSSIDMDGPTINLNSGTSTPVTPRARSGVSNDYPLQIPESASDSVTITLEELDPAAVDEKINSQIASGEISKKDVEKGTEAAKIPETVNEEPVTNNSTPLPKSCAIFANKTDIPDSTQISKYYTIGMVSSRAAASSAKITPQHGLSVSEIACNLKQVAENCLDKIKAQYPQMIVTSGFRKGSGPSQHERGQAIDMQFKVGNSEYYGIAEWIKNNVIFDQLLLEYKTIETGNAWIHISYAENPRKQVFTYMNHKNAGTGLRKLQ